MAMQFPAECGDLATWRWLFGPAGEAALLRAENLAQAGVEPLRLLSQLRKDLAPPQANLVLEQMTLRQTALRKFPWGDQLFWTRRALEQASDAAIAAYKGYRAAAFFAGGAETLHNAMGPEWQPLRGASLPLHDLCCGLGGDAWGFARYFSVTGYEADELTALIARENAVRWVELLRREEPTLNLSRLAILHQPVERICLGEIQNWHIDPDRRPAGSRTTEWQWHSPDGAFLQQLVANSPTGVIKGAPAAPRIAELAEPQTREWISTRRECRQQLVWLGDWSYASGHHVATRIVAERGEAGDGRREAGEERWEAGEGRRETQALGYGESAFHPNQGMRTNFFADSWCRYAAYSFVGEPGLSAAPSETWGPYLYEPDPAILAADLGGAFARQWDWGQVVPEVAYYSAATSRRHPLCSCFGVLAVLPWRAGPVRAWLKENRRYVAEIKKRGVPLRPEDVRQQLAAGSAAGDLQPVVLLLTSQNNRVVAIIAERIT
ncbi:MAG: hypothetical protein SFX18_07615 [Pirellulales bacterium]|nr:hypothetical protein [Pirellulales bacterium]